MSTLAPTQAALARLYTDGALRAEFFADPARVGVRLGLEAPAAVRLAAVAQLEIDDFARSLYRKRLNDVAKQLPLTRASLGPRFAEEFLNFAAAHPLAETTRRGGDALAFARRLEKILGAPDAAAEIQRDTVRYEAAGLRAARPGFCFVVRWLRWPLPNPDPAAAPGRQPARALAVWFRRGARGRRRHWVWQLPGRR